jgi:hypothetical protein
MSFCNYYSFYLKLSILSLLDARRVTKSNVVQATHNVRTVSVPCYKTTMVATLWPACLFVGRCCCRAFVSQNEFAIWCVLHASSGHNNLVSGNVCLQHLYAMLQHGLLPQPSRRHTINIHSVALRTAICYSYQIT